MEKTIEKKHRQLNPQKAKARQIAKNAVRDKRLRPKPCCYCGSKKVQMHHSDYNKPLKVKWVCFVCHREKEHNQTVTVKG
jgi:hypothetical protein